MTMTSPPPPVLRLASASPRRSALLSQLGVAHEVTAADVDESPLAGEAPEGLVVRLAGLKAERGARGDSRPALGADTVVCIDGRVLGKPRDADDAACMLKLLSGRGHRVLSGVALFTGEGVRTALSVSTVVFRTLAAREIEDYWASGEPRDKAGAYAVQGLAARFIARLEGSYSGVMGLPLYETATLLQAAGLLPPLGTRE
jgi:nucleoside triphosphate pyrophosphatase